MLAYVFWHWKQPQISPDEYETRQRAFHAALTAAPPADFSGSFSLALSGAPWAADGADAYEDWYLVRDFAALELLNEAAVSASRSAPHDAAAALAADGTAGVYKLQFGEVIRQPRFAHWFSKPQGLSYRDFNVQMMPFVDQCHGALWIRQMTLGPATEFCLQTEAPVSFPPGYTPRTLSLRFIWPE